MKSAAAPEKFEWEEFQKLSAWLESEEIYSVLANLGSVSEADLLRHLVGESADTRELTSSPESSKYPVEIAQIRLIQELKKVTRRIQVTRKLRELHQK